MIPNAIATYFQFSQLPVCPLYSTQHRDKKQFWQTNTTENEKRFSDEKLRSGLK